MSKIYVPTYSDSNCVVIRNNDIIRVYATRPTNNTTVNYTDYYIHNGYISNSGSESFNNYVSLPSCQSSDIITTEYGYRVDFPQIMVCAILMLWFGYFLISKLVRTIFIDWRYS